MRNSALLIMSLFCLSSMCLAKDLGNYGRVFEIKERDIREVIAERLQNMKDSHELERLEEEFKNRIASHVTRPKPGLQDSTRTPETFYIDPSIVVNQDIITPDNQVIAKKGTTINPFDNLTYSKTLFFFNADDKSQVAWVKKHYQDYNYVKFILTSGSVAEMAQIFGRVYFDLNGKLSQYFHLQHVPSVVCQDKKQWKIQEIGVSDV